MNILKTGSLAYYNSFSGAVPCRVLSITSKCPQNPHWGTNHRVRAVVTAKLGVYEKGEELEDYSLWIFPRESLRSQPTGAYMIGPYQVQSDLEEQ